MAEVVANGTSIENADMHLGAAIRVRRKELGRRLVQIASETGLSHHFLSQIERGRAHPSMRSLFLIAESLGTTQQALLARAVPLPADERGIRAVSGEHADRGGRAARLVDHDAGGAEITEMVAAITEFASFFTHTRRELVYVVAGRIEVELAPRVADGHSAASEIHQTLGP